MLPACLLALSVTNAAAVELGGDEVDAGAVPALARVDCALVGAGAAVERQQRGVILDGPLGRQVDDVLRHEERDVGHDAEVRLQRLKVFPDLFLLPGCRLVDIESLLPGKDLERVFRAAFLVRRIGPRAALFLAQIGLLLGQIGHHDHLMARGHHYGPGPWVSGGPRADWTSLYYHRADEEGIGFDRTKEGSDAVSQYFPPVRDAYGSLESVPEELLLWFHHVPWDHRMPSGRTLWEELRQRYQRAIDNAQDSQPQHAGHGRRTV